MNETILRELLADLSAAFQQRDVSRLLACFSCAPTATYAGSEAGESATGEPDLRRLFTSVLGREGAYSFRFPSLRFNEYNGSVWVLGEGSGIETRPNRPPEVFAYRVTGVLVLEESRWRWAVLCGAEPTAPV